MPHATLNMNGKTFVLVPEPEYRRLRSTHGAPEVLPMASQAHFPAVQTGRASIAREVIRRRQAVGLSQRVLAAAAGIRVETLNRIENAKVTADTATISKIDRALKRLEKSLAAGHVPA
jgi:DNA-binding XRE family transcriptional regulator